MNICNVKKNMCLKLRYFRSDQGFTLVELLVAMSILTLIIFAFTPLLVSSIERIHYAGDKSEALYEGQSEVEVNIAERKTTEGYDLEFTFGDPDNSGTVINVPGGLVDADITKGEATAWLRGYVPFIPSMSIDPSLFIEGYDVETINVTLENTTDDITLENGQIITIYDNLGFKAQLPTLYEINKCGANDDYMCAKFDLNIGITNSYSPYLAILKWELDDGIEVYVDARIQIVLPYASAVGEGQRLWISPDADELWRHRNHQGTGTGTFRDIIWTGFEYVAVSSSGRILVWSNRQEPKLASQTFGYLNSVTYGNGKYLAVGNNGQIVISENAIQWDSEIINSNNLNAVNWSGNEFVTVGDNGTILALTDLAGWELFEWGNDTLDVSDIKFKGLDYGNSFWLAVGGEHNSNAVIFKSDGVDWIRIEDETVESALPLNDVIYDGTRFIAVGNNGTILTSTDGVKWKDESITTESNLLAIDWGDIDGIDDRYIIVGENGTVITWTGKDSDPWVLKSIDIFDIYGVAIRWTR